MVTREEKMLWAFENMQGEERCDAIKAMWCRLMEEYETIPLWPKGETPHYDPAIPDQLEPSIVLFRVESDRPRGTVLVAPGGGFAIKAPFEGFDVARRFNELGLNAAGLDYRLRRYTIRDAVGDAQRALRTLRCHAAEWGLDPDHIGMGGFSAGGMLTGMAATHFDGGDPDSDDPVERMTCRPDAAILCYGAFSSTTVPQSFVTSSFTDPEREEKIYMSPEKNLRHDGPPFFMWQTNMQDDPRHVLRLSIELTDRGIPFELHCFPMGNHGLALADGENEQRVRDPHIMHWIELCAEWLKSLGF